MRNPAKMILKFFLFGLCWGCTCFTAMLALRYATGGPRAISAMLPDFLAQIAGALVVGPAFTMPAILYRIRRIPTPVSVMIHMAVGMGVSGPIAVHFGWIPSYPDRPWMLAVEICIGIGVFDVIWLVFYLLNRHEAKAINQRVRQLAGSENEKGRAQGSASRKGKR